MPGEFATYFPNTEDTDLESSLADGFAEAQLQGFFSTLTLDELETSEELSLAGQALVTLFTGMRIIRAQIRQLNTSSRYKAGPVEIETQKAATVLKEEMAYLRQRLDSLIQVGRTSGRVVHVHDGYLGRMANPVTLGAFAYYEYPGSSASWGRP